MSDSYNNIIFNIACLATAFIISSLIFLCIKCNNNYQQPITQEYEEQLLV